VNLSIFDDKPAKFFPVSLTRSVGDVRCGILKLRQRLQALLFGETDFVIIDKDLVHLYQDRHPDWRINKVEGDTLLVNSRIKITPESIKAIRNLKTGQGIKSGENVVIAIRKTITKMDVNYLDFRSLISDIEFTDNKLPLYENMADIISDNARLIEFDFEQFFHDSENFIETEPGVTILNPYQVWIGENSILKPGVVIDATHGPIVIDEHATVMSNSVIIGPAYVGKGSQVKIGSKIYGGTSIGPVCKVGGEIEGSIIQAYTNKQHNGFLGHAYLGEWVNMGAGTCNSDLKNNYQTISFYSYEEKAKVQSGSQFLGSIVADHVKTGINCSLNTGIVIGVGCNLWGRDLIKDHIPSFSWGEARNLQAYKFDAFVNTARIVKQRRNLKLSDPEIDLFKNIWAQEQQG
jgi:UDP-N-acetylglucosamine diphosphorylase/glucosamine-1-phosphate N-acetyltransferase